MMNSTLLSGFPEFFYGLNAAANNLNYSVTMQKIY